jgi:hypothetical protein
MDLGKFLGLGETIDEAKKSAQDLVEVAMASVMGNLKNEPGGLIPYFFNSLNTFLDSAIGPNGKVDKLVDRTLDKLAALDVTFSPTIKKKVGK